MMTMLYGVYVHPGLARQRVTRARSTGSDERLPKLAHNVQRPSFAVPRPVGFQVSDTCVTCREGQRSVDGSANRASVHTHASLYPAPIHGLGAAHKGALRTDAKMCDSPKIKTSTPTKKKPEEEDEEEQKAPLTPSQRKRSEEEIILSAPASAQSAKSKDSPEKEPKSKKQKRQSEKLKCISSPKPIGI